MMAAVRTYSRKRLAEDSDHKQPFKKFRNNNEDKENPSIPLALNSFHMQDELAKLATLVKTEVIESSRSLFSPNSCDIDLPKTENDSQVVEEDVVSLTEDIGVTISIPDEFIAAGEEDSSEILTSLDDEVIVKDEIIDDSYFTESSENSVDCTRQSRIEFGDSFTRHTSSYFKMPGSTKAVTITPVAKSPDEGHSRSSSNLSFSSGSSRVSSKFEVDVVTSSNSFTISPIIAGTVCKTENMDFLDSEAGSSFSATSDTNLASVICDDVVSDKENFSGEESSGDEDYDAYRGLEYVRKVRTDIGITNYKPATILPVKDSERRVNTSRNKLDGATCCGVNTVTILKPACSSVKSTSDGCNIRTVVLPLSKLADNNAGMVYDFQKKPIIEKPLLTPMPPSNVLKSSNSSNHYSSVSSTTENSSHGQSCVSLLENPVSANSLQPSSKSNISLLSISSAKPVSSTTSLLTSTISVTSPISLTSPLISSSISNISSSLPNSSFISNCSKNVLPKISVKEEPSPVSELNSSIATSSPLMACTNSVSTHLKPLKSMTCVSTSQIQTSLTSVSEAQPSSSIPTSAGALNAVSQAPGNQQTFLFQPMHLPGTPKPPVLIIKAKGISDVQNFLKNKVVVDTLSNKLSSVPVSSSNSNNLSSPQTNIKEEIIESNDICKENICLQEKTSLNEKCPLHIPPKSKVVVFPEMKVAEVRICEEDVVDLKGESSIDVEEFYKQRKLIMGKQKSNLPVKSSVAKSKPMPNTCLKRGLFYQAKSGYSQIVKVTSKKSSVDKNSSGPLVEPGTIALRSSNDIHKDTMRSVYRNSDASAQIISTNHLTSPTVDLESKQISVATPEQNSICNKSCESSPNPLTIVETSYEPALEEDAKSTPENCDAPLNCEETAVDERENSSCNGEERQGDSKTRAEESTKLEKVVTLTQANNLSGLVNSAIAYVVEKNSPLVEECPSVSKNNTSTYGIAKVNCKSILPSQGKSFNSNSFKNLLKDMSVSSKLVSKSQSAKRNYSEITKQSYSGRSKDASRQMEPNAGTIEVEKGRGKLTNQLLPSTSEDSGITVQSVSASLVVSPLPSTASAHKRSANIMSHQKSVRKKPVYLDYNATTPLDPTVIEAIHSSLKEHWANPSSSYEGGVVAKEAVSSARLRVAGMLGCRGDNIVFTSGGTESNNLAITSAIRHYRLWLETSGNLQSDLRVPHVITSDVEHDSVKNVLMSFTDVEVTVLSWSSSPEDIVAHVRASTCLITFMLANNETGVMLPIPQLTSSLEGVNRARARQGLFRVLVHTDASQCIGKVFVKVDALKVDYLTFTGHKFYGPRVGALFVKEDMKGFLPLYPQLFGGGQERGLRPGTENTPMLVGLGVACKLVNDNLQAYIKNMRKMSAVLVKALKKHFGMYVKFNCVNKCLVNSPAECAELCQNYNEYGTVYPRLPNTVSVAFYYKNITAKQILDSCPLVQCSKGSACHSSGAVAYDKSVLKSFGICQFHAERTLRLSVGRETTAVEVESAVFRLKVSVTKLLEVVNAAKRFQQKIQLQKRLLENKEETSPVSSSV